MTATERQPITKATVVQYGLRAFEVVHDGRQVALFRCRHNHRVGSDDLPTAGDLQEARQYAELFALTINEEPS